MSVRFRPKFNIRKGDSVAVIAGDDKDLRKPRKVLAVYPKDARVLIEGVNMVKRHQKPTAQNTKGQIITKEAPIHISNVMLWDAEAKAPSRVRRERSDQTFKRITQKSGTVLAWLVNGINGIRLSAIFWFSSIFLAMQQDRYIPRASHKYKSEVLPYLMQKFQYGTHMQAPRLLKIVVNRGVRGAVEDKKLVEESIEEITRITGQKAIATYSVKDISNFKLRKGLPIGVKVTLRKARMYEFLDRLISVALPRVRDFRGISEKSFDGRGNYTMGITEQIIFPEINIDQIKKITGMDITFVTSAKTDAEAYELLKSMGLPFRNARKT